MGIGTSPCKALLFITVWLLATPALAQVPQLAPLNFNARYEVAWNGIVIGRVIVEIREDAFSYRIMADTKTSGIAKMFSKEKSLAKSQGRILGGSYYPASYASTNIRSADNIIRTAITYDEDTDIVREERTPRDDPKWRPAVPRPEANSGYDPVTAFLIARSKLRHAMARNEKQVKVRTYDGARLAELTIAVINPARIEKMGEYVNAINTVVSRQPINGYTPKEWKKFKEGDPPIHLYLSADADLMPLQISVALSFGTLTAKLKELETH